MRQAPANIDKESVQFRTVRRKAQIEEHLEIADALRQDRDREDRLKDSSCKACHYLKALLKDSSCKACHYLKIVRIAGQAFISRPCGICLETDIHSSNTNVDPLCLDCANKHSLCRHCGADLELRKGRRLFAWIQKKGHKK